MATGSDRERISISAIDIHAETARKATAHMQEVVRAMDGQPFVIETISPLDAGNKTFAYGNPMASAYNLEVLFLALELCKHPMVSTEYQ